MNNVRGFYKDLLIHKGDLNFPMTALAGNLNLPPERVLMRNIPPGEE